MSLSPSQFSGRWPKVISPRFILDFVGASHGFVGYLVTDLGAHPIAGTIYEPQKRPHRLGA